MYTLVRSPTNWSVSVCRNSLTWPDQPECVGKKILKQRMLSKVWPLSNVKGKELYVNSTHMGSHKFNNLCIRQWILNIIFRSDYFTSAKFIWVLICLFRINKQAQLSWWSAVDRVYFFYLWGSYFLAVFKVFMTFLAHFGHFGWLPYQKGKKIIKWKSCASSIPIWKVASVFSYSVRKDFKITKNWQKTYQKKEQKSHTCTRTNIINQLKRPILTYAESFVKFWLDLAEIPWTMNQQYLFCSGFTVL